MNIKQFGILSSDTQAHLYSIRGGVCLKTQYYPDAVNRPQWKQPFFAAGKPYHSETKYIFL